MIQGAFEQLGKNLLRTMFPSVYATTDKLRSIKAVNDNEEEHKSPVIKAIQKLNKDVKQSNEITSDSLEALLIQNDLLTKILKKGGLGSGGGILSMLEKLMPKSIGGAVVGAAEIVGGAALAKKGLKGLKGLGKLAKSGIGKLLKGNPVLSFLIGGAEEYYESGNVVKATAAGVGTAAGAAGGAALGAIAGSILLPGIGTAIGGFLGSFAGSWVGSKLARSGYDLASGGKGGSHSLEANVINYKAGDILLKARDIILNVDRIVGLGQVAGSGGTIGTPTTTGSGSSPVYRPGVGGNAGQRRGREPYMPRKEGEGADPTGGKAVPPELLSKAEGLLMDGGNSADLQQFMAKNGYPKSGNWCGEFAAAVVKSAGGTPPRNPAIASNWIKYGEHVDPKDVKPGDIAVRTRSRYGGDIVPGQTGGHVGFVHSRDERGNFQLSGGNQGRPVSGNQSMSGYEFRRPTEEKPEAAQQPAPPPIAAPQQAPPTQPTAAPVQAPAGPQSYKVDMPGILKVIREKKMGAALVSDDYIKDEIRKGVIKDNPSVKFNNSTITGDKAELDKIKAGFNKELGTDVSDYIRPIPTESVKTVPVPVRSADPAVERLKAERDKAKKDLQRIKKKNKTDKADKLDDAGGEDAPPPKDNTRSDRALFNINPQLHQENHPQ